MKRQTRQLCLRRAPSFIALFSILPAGRLVALDLELMRVGGYDTSGVAHGVAVSGNYAYVADGTNGLHVIEKHKTSHSAHRGSPRAATASNFVFQQNTNSPLQSTGAISRRAS